MATSAHVAPTVFLDADNTLWDTDSVFAAAQMSMLENTAGAVGLSSIPPEPLAFVRSVDQAIAEKHQDGLRYPPKLLVRALEKALAGVASDAAARAALRGRHEYRIPPKEADNIVAVYIAALQVIPPLRDGVLLGLKALRSRGFRLIVISEGAKSRVEKAADAHGILDFFERIIEGRKGPALYRRMVALGGIEGPAFMVGDQLDRDIEPAGRAGLQTIYYPSSFSPRWSGLSAAVVADFVVTNFAQVEKIVAARSAQLKAA